MKLMFVHAKSPLDLTLTKEALAKLPKGPLGIVTITQHLHKIRQVLDQLPGSILVGQVLGCRADNVARVLEKVDAFLFVGTGEFHPIRISLEAKGKDVFIYDPTSREMTKLSKQLVAGYQKKVKGLLLRFYSAKNVGLLVTTKVGQNNGVISTYSLDTKMKLPLEFMKRKDKNYFLFAFDTLNHQALDDFSFIDCWVNFACNRIMDDKNNKIVNVQDILEAEHESAS